MAGNYHKISGRELMSNYTLNVEIVNPFGYRGWRMWLACRLIKAGAFILGCDIEFKERQM